MIPVSGDVGVGSFEPGVVARADFRRLPPERLAAVAQLSGLSSTASDVLDELAKANSKVVAGKFGKAA